MTFKAFLHWIGTMIVSAFAAWWAHNHPGTTVETVLATGCVSHFIGHVGAKPDDPAA